MSYSIEPSKSDCYENTICLINKLDIRDAEVLSAVEAKITLAKIAMLSEHPIEGSFDFNHYKAIHKFIFEDLYDWAGQERTVNISKKGTVFVEAQEISEIADRIFSRLEKLNYFQNLDFDSFVDNIADFYCTTNMLHPFREGNGRTQRVFLQQLIRKNGYEINFADIDSDLLMIATIQAANGIKDNLINLFKESIK